MDSKSIAKRYAEGLLKSARENNTFDKTLGEFRDLRRVLREHKSVLHLLKNPVLFQVDKNAFIDKVFQNGFSVEMRHFLKYLVRKRRIDLLPDVIEYIRFSYASGDELEAVLKTTFPLDLELIKEIKEKAQRILNRRLKLFIHLDPDLMGGVNLIVGHRLIDYSINYSLLELKEKLLSIKIK